MTKLISEEELCRQLAEKRNKQKNNTVNKPLIIGCLWALLLSIPAWFIIYYLWRAIKMISGAMS